MQDNSESFRNEVACKLIASLSPDAARQVLSLIDETIYKYDISRKQMSLIPSDGVPDVVKYFIAGKSVENLSMKTLNIYRLRLIDFFRFVRKPFSDVRPNDIRMYIYYYKQHRNASNSYLDSIRRTLSSFFSWLVDNEYLIRNPCASIERIKFQPAERNPLTSYELEVLRWNCNTIREKALVDFLFSTGVRVSECQDVNISDINWEARSVVIHHGKGDKRRVVFFNAESELTLRKYLESRDDDNDALFVTIRKPHHRMGVRSLQSEIARISSRCDLHVFPHALRHTFATSGLRGGMSLDKLQALLGHSKPETTLIYAKLDISTVQMEHQRIYA